MTFQYFFPLHTYVFPIDVLYMARLDTDITSSVVNQYKLVTAREKTKRKLYLLKKKKKLYRITGKLPKISHVQ